MNIKPLAPVTTRAYNAAFQHYLEFCMTHNFKALPIVETNLMLFVTNISHHSPLTQQLIYKYLRDSGFSLHDKTMMSWAAVTTAFFGFLWSTVRGHITLKYPNINVNIKTSKTDQFREGCNICLSPSNADDCPVINLTNHMNVDPTRS